MSLENVNRRRERSQYNEESARAEIYKSAEALPDSTELAVILDLDETVANTVELWVKKINEFLVSQFGVDESLLPTYEAMFQKGHGTDAVYPQHFPKGYEDVYEVFLEALRQMANPNIFAHPMEPGIGEKFKKAFSFEGLKAKVIGSITARPGTDRVMRATEIQMSRKFHLDHFPVLGRPNRVKHNESASWKIAEMLEIAKHLKKQVIVIIDDSLSLAKAIMKYNKDRKEDQPFLVQVVYPGPFTKAKIDSKDESTKFVADPENGIFIAEQGWDTMGPTLLGVQQWLQTHLN